MKISELVVTTPLGRRYHTTVNCSALMQGHYVAMMYNRRQLECQTYTVPEAKRIGRRPCKRCAR